MNYFLFTKDATDTESLALATADFLEKEYHIQTYALLVHTPHPAPLTVLKDPSNSFNPNEWIDKEQLSLQHIKSNLYLQQQDTFLVFSGIDFLNEKIFIFKFMVKPEVEVLNILEQWQSQHQYLKNVLGDLDKDHETRQGNLISQLLHDVQSLMDFQPRDITEPEHAIRLNYQNSVNENLLFYIRPVELLIFNSPVIDLIYASVQILGIEKKDFPLRVSGEIADIDLDAELFSKALNAVVLNAQESNAAKPVDWEIHVEQISGSSPFINQNWLQISIIDQGPGIKADYLPFITDPFFTTKKVAGHSGFGLSNAKKILEAHGGHLQISTKMGRGTQVKLIFPYRDDESKNSNN